MPINAPRFGPRLSSAPSVTSSPFGGGRIGTLFLRSPTRPGQTSPAVAGDRRGYRQNEGGRYELPRLGGNPIDQNTGVGGGNRPLIAPNLPRTNLPRPGTQATSRTPPRSTNPGPAYGDPQDNQSLIDALTNRTGPSTVSDYSDAIQRAVERSSSVNMSALTGPNAAMLSYGARNEGSGVPRDDDGGGYGGGPGPQGNTGGRTGPGSPADPPPTGGGPPTPGDGKPPFVDDETPPGTGGTGGGTPGGGGPGDPNPPPPEDPPGPDGPDDPPEEPPEEPPEPPPGEPDPPPPGGDGSWDLSNLAALLAQRLNQPSAFGTEEIQQLREWLASEREASRIGRTADLEADAASRGVFYGTPLTTSLGDLESELARAEAGHDVQLTQLAAQYQQEGMNRAIQDAMNFLQFASGERNSMFQNALAAANAGGAGGPDINTLLAGIMGLPGGSVEGLDPGFVELLSFLFPGITGGGQ